MKAPNKPYYKTKTKKVIPSKNFTCPFYTQFTNIFNETTMIGT